MCEGHRGESSPESEPTGPPILGRRGRPHSTPMITDGVSNGNISTPLRYWCDRSRVRNAIAIAYGYSRQHTSFWKESNQVRQPSASSALLHMLLLLSALAPHATRSRRRPAPRTSSCATHFQLSIFSRPPALGIGCAKRSGFSRSRRRYPGRPGLASSHSPS